MKNILIIFVILFNSIFASVHASDKVIQNPPFFKITAPNGKVSYALGTIHFGIAAKDLPPKVASVFARTKTHFYEVEIELETMDYVFMNIRDPVKFKKYWDQLRSEGLAAAGPALSQDQKRRGRELGLPSHVLENINSNSSCVFLYYADFLYSRPFHQLDVELSLISKALKKSVRALETEADRDKSYAYAAKMTGQDEEEDDCTVGRVLSFDEYTADLKTFFKSGIYRSLIQPYKQSQCSITARDWKERNYSVEYRNRAWVKVLKPYLDKGSVFIAAGAGHFKGINDLPFLLRQSGYKVEQK